MPGRGRFGVKGDGNVRGLLVLQDVEQGVGEDKQGRAVDALRREDGPADQREVRAINQRHAVEQEKFFLHGPRLAQPAGNPNKKSATHR